MSGSLDVVVNTGAVWLNAILHYSDGNFYAYGEDSDTYEAIYKITTDGVCTRVYTGTLPSVDDAGFELGADGWIYFFRTDGTINRWKPGNDVETIASGLSGDDLTIDPVSGLIYGGSPNSPLFSVDPITHTITTLLLNIDSNYGYGYAWYNGSLYTANNWFGKIIF